MRQNKKIAHHRLLLNRNKYDEINFLLRLGSQKMEFVTADWGGTEGICAELREIQKQINS